MPTTTRTFRVFVSSTFEDLKLERNVLQHDVFPRLRALCELHGARFQAIDLRWGVSEEAGLDQQAVRICVEEIKRCQRTTPKPNFLVLLGDRYGWRPLPAEIPAGEFESLAGHVAAVQERRLLAAWYKRDDNAVPAAYYLQPRHVDMPASAGSEQVEAARTRERCSWTDTEARLRAILLEAATRIDLPEEARHKYETSATEQEIDQGVLAIPDAAEHVFCFFRKINALPEGAEAAGFRDLDEGGQVDVGARTCLEVLRDRLRHRLPGNVRDYDAGWNGIEPTDAHLTQLCEDAYSVLSKVILAEIEQIESRDAVQKEIEDHAAFGRDRARFFVGRVAILETIAAYIRGEGPHPLGVFGEGGSGKSALMARASELAREEMRSAEIVTRFIGATPTSYDGRALLEGLCREISQKYGDDSDTPNAYEELIGEFPKRLDLASTEKPLIMFLDSLDQLFEPHNARGLVWLPRTLPPFVRIVLTTRPGEQLVTLSNGLPHEKLVELEPMLIEEGHRLLDVWLEADGRTLQGPQKEHILRAFKANGLPLYLRLAFIAARQWRSYTGLAQLRPDVAGIVQDLYERLSSEDNHGAVLVSHSLGYLAASRDTNGLSEDELLDVLSADTEVFADFKRRAVHEPPGQKLPVVVWSRLYFDLDPYLAERSAEGATLLTFYHRELGDVARTMYLPNSAVAPRHRALATYFLGKLDPKRDKRWDGAHPRSLSELPYHLAKAQMRDELFETLTAFRFLERKAAEVGVTEATSPDGETTKTHVGVFALLADYDRASSVFPARDSSGCRPTQRRSDSQPTERGYPADRSVQRTVLEAFSRTLTREAHVLTQSPEVLWQQMYNRLQWADGPDRDGPVTRVVQSELRERSRPGARLWLRLLTRFRESEALIRSFIGHTNRVRAVAWSPDGSRIVSGSSDCTVKVWDAASGFLLIRLMGHTGPVNAVGYSPDGMRIVSGSADHTLKVWDATTGRELRTFPGHSKTVTSVAFSPDGLRVVSASADKVIKTWDVATGEEYATISTIGPGARLLTSLLLLVVRLFVPLMVPKSMRGKLWEDIVDIFSNLDCSFSPDGRRIVSGSMVGGLRTWDAHTGEKTTITTGFGVDLACACSPDGRRIVSSRLDGDNTLKIRDASTGVEVATLTGHAFYVHAVAYSPDGTRVVSGSDDMTLRVWDASSGTELAILAGHAGWVRAAAYSPDGMRIVSGSDDNTLKVWDAGAGTERATPIGHTQPVSAVAYSPDGTRIVSGSDDKTLKVWDAATGAEIATFTGHQRQVQTVSYSPDGLCIVSGSWDKTVKVWNAATGTELVPLTGHTDVVSAASYSPDGRRIVSGSWDKTIKVWDAVTGAEMMTLSGHTARVWAVDYSPDGQRIVSGSGDNTIKVWDVVTGGELATFTGHTSAVRAVAYSPDGRRIVSGSVDHDLRIWDAIRGTQLALLTGHTDSVRAVAWSPDGTRIVSGSADGMLKVWDDERSRCVATMACLGPLGGCDLDPRGARICCGDASGTVYISEIVGSSACDPFW